MPSATITREQMPIQGRWLVKAIVNPLSASFLIFGFIGFILIIIGLLYAKIWIIIGVFTVATCVPFVVTIWFFEFVQYLMFQFFLEEREIKVSQGFFGRVERSSPYGRIQGVYVSQDLLDRLLHLATVRVETAAGIGAAMGQRNSAISTLFIGSIGNSIIWPGLSLRDAGLLREAILERMKANPVSEAGSGI